MLRIRDLAPADRAAVLALNNAAVPAVNALDDTSLAELLALADRSWVAAEDPPSDPATLGGALIALAPHSSYASPNYRWLDARFGDYRYVDRVLVAPTHRREGLGTRLYAALAEHARAHGAARLLCEVNVEPPNPRSVAFHESDGWKALEDVPHVPEKVVRFFQRTL
jgi:hypothetical protein